MRTNVVVGNCEKSLVNSGGGSRSSRGPNSFNFMQFLGKFGKIVNWRPPPESWHRHLGEILDPPLSDANEISIQWVFNGFSLVSEKITIFQLF